MPEAHIIRRIRNSPEDLYGFVADVEKYPEFINLISALRITKTLSETEFEAEAVVAYKMISESFRSHVMTDADALKIEVTKAEKGGAVKSLLNRWQFHPLKDGSTLIDVVVDVRLKARSLEFLLRNKFSSASVHIVSAFERRAGQILPVVGEADYDFKAEAKALGVNLDNLV
jgi:coenzyme Q-binding protein COQ10